GAGEDGHAEGGGPDGEENPPAIKHAREQVLAEIVGAEGMLPRWPLKARVEIDVVDRDAPDQRRQRYCGDHRQQDEGARERQPMTPEPTPGVPPRREIPRGTLRRRGNISRA